MTQKKALKFEPKISIIVPVYNVEQYLNRCVDSLINQSYKNLEIILVNDGSTDESGKICDFYSSSDSRVLVVHQDNKGLSGARNSGLKNASGDYIGFVDSDDWIDPNMYKTMLETLNKHEVDIVECGIFGTTKLTNALDSTGSIIKEDRLQALKRIIKNQDFSVCSRLYHKKLIEGILFIEGKNSEDTYFTYDVFKKVANSIYITTNFYYYFLGNDSITRGAYKLKVLDSVDAAIHLKNKIALEEDDKELKELSRKLLLDVLLYNYKMLNYNYTLDKDCKYRKRIKSLIKENFSINTSSFYLGLARVLPIRAFNAIINLNSIRRRNKT